MKSKKNIVILMFVIAISLFGITYAFFDYYKLGVNQEIISGRVSLILTEGTDTINISNVFPESAEKARARTDNKITFTITGHNTTLDNDIYYEIMLNEGDEEAGMTRFNPYDLCFDLVEIDDSGNRIYVFEQMSFEDFNARRIWVNTVDRETELDISRTYELRMWLNENVKISDTNPNRDYPATGFENYYASVKVSVFGDFAEKEISYQSNYLARVSDTQFWPNEIMNSMQTISEVQAVAMGQSEIDTRYNAATIKADVTFGDTATVQQTSAMQLSYKPKAMEDAEAGNVYVWLENDPNNEGFYIMYIASDGFTYFPSDCSLMFSGFMNVTSFVFENVNTSKVTDMGGMFYYCFNVSDLDLRKFDTSNVTSFTKITFDPYGNEMKMGMFGQCIALSKLNMTGWNTSKVTNMAGMFGGCLSLTSLDVSHFDTSSVTDMSGMFESCSSLINLNLKNFDTSQVINMSNMFYYCKGLTSLNINGWNTSNVLDMSFMFGDCRSLTSLNVSHFDTSKVTNMVSMFSGLQNLTKLDVSNFDTSQVTDMGNMFGYSTDEGGGGLGITTLDVSHFDTSNVTNMYALFSGCKNVTNLNVSDWDTSKVTSINSMFAGCISLDSLDLSKWNTSLVEDTGSAFSGCTNLKTLILSNWNTSKVTSMSNMFENCTGLTSLDLKSFNTSLVANMIQLFDGCTNLKTLDISGFTFESIDGNISFIFRGMLDDAQITVGSTTIQDYILALDTDNNRPANWTTENVIVGA